MRKYLLVTKTDTNDADYVRSTCFISREQANRIREISKKAVMNNADQNYTDSPQRAYKDVLTDDEIDFMQGFCEGGEYGFQSIDSMKVIEVVGAFEELLVREHRWNNMW